MSGRYRRFNFRSLKEDKEIDKDKKDVDTFTSKDGAVTIVKTEKIKKNYFHNKLIKNDEDAKIIQDFCRKKMKPIFDKIKEEEQKRIKKEQQEEAEKKEINSKRGFYSRYRRHLKKEQDNSDENKNKDTEIQDSQNNDEIYKSKRIKENIEGNERDNQTEKNNEESYNGKKLFRGKFQKNAQNSNENASSEKVQNEQDEKDNSIRYKRKIITYEEKNEQNEEKKPKFVPTYHEKRKVEHKIDNEEDLIGKNYKCREIEVIPVRLCDDYDDYYYPRMRFYSPVKPKFVEPYLNPDIIITKITVDKSYIPQNNIGLQGSFNNNVNYYKQNLSRNESFYRNQNLYGRRIFPIQYRNECILSRPFTNVVFSRNDGNKLGRSQNSQFNNHGLKTSYASGYICK